MIPSEEIGLKIAEKLGLKHVQSIAVILNLGQPAKLIVTRLLDEGEGKEIQSIMEQYQLDRKEEE